MASSPRANTGNNKEDESDFIIYATFFQNTNGKKWSNNANWTDVKPTIMRNNYYLSWFGFSKDGHGIKLDLSNNCLSGTLDKLPEFSKFSSLNLSNNRLQSTLEGIQSLTSLRVLNLKHNNFSGRIPDEFNPLSRLISLNLAYNLLTGDLPNSISVLTSLEKLQLRNNKLSGKIDKVCNLTKLVELNLQNNWFKDEIPSDIFNMKSLRFLYLGKNCFTKSIPNNIGNATALKELFLEGNVLTGIIPQSLSSLSALEKLNLSNNSLKGSCLIGTSSMLEEVDLSQNCLSGLIPAFVTHDANLGDLYVLPKLKKLNLSFNNLNGEIPDLVCRPRPESKDEAIATLQILNMSRNKLTGKLKEIPDTVTHVDLSGNELEGGIPSEFCKSKLKSLKLQSNKLTGVLPDSFSGLSDLTVLNIGNNKISNVEVLNTTALKKLEVLCIENNEIEDIGNFLSKSARKFQRLEVSNCLHHKAKNLPKQYLEERQLWKYARNEHFISAAGIATSGNYAVTVSVTDRNIVIWDLQFGTNTSRRCDNNPISSVAMSANGKTILLGTTEAAILYTSDDDNEVQCSSTRFEGSVQLISLNRDGDMVAVAYSSESLSEDVTTLCYFSTTDMRKIKCTKYIQSPILCMSIDTSKSAIVTGHEDGNISIWHMNKKNSSLDLLSMRREHNTKVRAVAANDGHIVSGSEDSDIIQWKLEIGNNEKFKGDSKSGTEKSAKCQIFSYLATPHKKGITSIALNSNSSRFASSSLDQIVILFDMQSNQVLRLIPFTCRVLEVDISDDGETLFAVTEEAIFRYEPEIFFTPRVLREHALAVRASAISCDGRIFITGGDNAATKFWKVKHTEGKYGLFDTFQLLDNTEVHATNQSATAYSQSITAVAMSSEGNVAASATAGKTLHIWSIERQNYSSADTITPAVDDDVPCSKQHLKAIDADGVVKEISISSDGKIVAWCLKDQSAYIWRQDYSRETCVAKSGIQSLRLDGSGDYLFLLSKAEKTEFQILSVGSQDITTGLETGAVVGADAGTGVDAGADAGTGLQKSNSFANFRRLSIKLVSDDFQITPIFRHDSKLNNPFQMDISKNLFANNSDSVNRDSKLFSLKVVTCERTSICVCTIVQEGKSIFRVEDEEELDVAKAHRKGLLRVAISSDGTRAVSAGQDIYAVLWDTVNKTWLRRITGHTSLITSVSISMEGNCILTTDEEGIVLMHQNMFITGRETFGNRAELSKALISAANDCYEFESNDDFDDDDDSPDSYTKFKSNEVTHLLLLDHVEMINKIQDNASLVKQEPDVSAEIKTSSEPEIDKDEFRVLKELLSSESAEALLDIIFQMCPQVLLPQPGAPAPFTWIAWAIKFSSTKNIKCIFKALVNILANRKSNIPVAARVYKGDNISNLEKMSDHYSDLIDIDTIINIHESLPDLFLWFMGQLEVVPNYYLDGIEEKHSAYITRENVLEGTEKRRFEKMWDRACGKFSKKRLFDYTRQEIYEIVRKTSDDISKDLAKYLESMRFNQSLYSLLNTNDANDENGNQIQDLTLDTKKSSVANTNANNGPPDVGSYVDQNPLPIQQQSTSSGNYYNISSRSLSCEVDCITITPWLRKVDQTAANTNANAYANANANATNSHDTSSNSANSHPLSASGSSTQRSHNTVDLSGVTLDSLGKISQQNIRLSSKTGSRELSISDFIGLNSTDIDSEPNENIENHLNSQGSASNLGKKDNLPDTNALPNSPPSSELGSNNTSGSSPPTDANVSSNQNPLHAYYDQIQAECGKCPSIYEIMTFENLMQLWPNTKHFVINSTPYMRAQLFWNDHCKERWEKFDNEACRIALILYENFSRNKPLFRDVPYEVNFMLVPLKDICKPEALKAILLCADLIDDKQVFQKSAIQHMIDYKWKTYVRMYFIRDFVWLLVEFICFAANALLFESYLQSPSPGLKFLCALLILVISILWAFSQNRKDFLYSGKHFWQPKTWDFWDVVNRIVGLLVFITEMDQIVTLSMQGDGRKSSVFAAATLPLLGVQSLFFLGGLRSTGPFVRMLIKITMGVRVFALILFVVIAAFAGSFALLFKNLDLDMPDFGTYFMSLLSVYGFLFGSFDYANLENAKSPFLALALLCVFLFFIVLVLLNLLIAYMGDLYDDVQDNNVAEMYYGMAKIIVKYETIISERHREANKEKWYPKYLQILEPEKQEGIDWESRSFPGRIPTLKRENKKIVSEIQMFKNEIFSELRKLQEALEAKNNSESSTQSIDGKSPNISPNNSGNGNDIDQGNDKGDQSSSNSFNNNSSTTNNNGNRNQYRDNRGRNYRSRNNPGFESPSRNSIQQGTPSLLSPVSSNDLSSFDDAASPDHEPRKRNHRRNNRRNKKKT